MAGHNKCRLIRPVGRHLHPLVLIFPQLLDHLNQAIVCLILWGSGYKRLFAVVADEMLSDQKSLLLVQPADDAAMASACHTSHLTLPVGVANAPESSLYYIQRGAVWCLPASGQGSARVRHFLVAQLPPGGMMAV